MKLSQYIYYVVIVHCIWSCKQSSLRSEKQNIVKLAVMGTNDLHGTAFPKNLYRTDTGEKYKYGGLVYLARLLNIVKAQYGNRAIYLDTGDQFQGGVESGPQVSKGQIIADFFNALDLKASALGNHEFDYGRDFLLNYLNFKNSSSLAANLYSEKGEPNFLPKHKSSQIFQLSGIKLGVIGLATTETPTTTSGFSSGAFPQYQFHEYPEVTIRQTASLKERGAEIIVVLAHFGNKCTWNKTYDIRNNQTVQETCENDQVLTFIDALPEGTIDGIFCGHRHQFVHHWYRNVPFMGVIDGGYYFNIMYFYFDIVIRKIVSTEIQGPIPVCQKIFSNLKSCQFQTSDQLITAGPLKSWVFHNKPVYMDEEVNKIFTQKYEQKMKKLSIKLIDNEILLERIKHSENPLANLMSSLMLKIGKQFGREVDFSVINHGAFRSTWYPGQILDEHFYNMFPFQNKLVIFDISGQNLLEMISRVQNGWDGFYFFDGIFQTLSLTKIINPNNLKDFTFRKGFVNATLLNGSQIENDKIYSGITLEFLLKGGDDFVKAFGEFIDPKTGRKYKKLEISNIQKLQSQRKLFYEELKKLKTIRESQWEVKTPSQRVQVLIQETE